MSKVNESKVRQGYSETPENCGNCSQRTCERYLPAWMQQMNEGRERDGYSPMYGESNKVERNQRCAVGGFAVKKTASCKLWSKA